MSNSAATEDLHRLSEDEMPWALRTCEKLRQLVDVTGISASLSILLPFMPMMRL